MDLAALDPWALGAIVAAGLVAGFVNTMAGGGSLLTLPALMLAGLPADLANGTNRLCIVTQSASGILGFHRAGKLDTASIVPILAPTAVGSLLGALLASFAPRELLEPVLLGTMVLMAVVMVVAPRFGTGSSDEPALSLSESRAGLIGLFAAGIYGGFVQAGVGFPLLAVLGGVLRYDLVRANALKLVATLVFGVVALAVFIARGQVVWLPALILAVTTVVGSQIGVRFAVRVKQEVIRWIILACVLATCVGVLVKG